MRIYFVWEDMTPEFWEAVEAESESEAVKLFIKNELRLKYLDKNCPKEFIVRVGTQPHDQVSDSFIALATVNIDVEVENCLYGVTETVS